MRAIARLMHIGVFGLLALGLVGCLSNMRPSSQSQAIQDGGPDRDVDVTRLADAVPEKVIITGAGNRSPYTVLGKTYYVNFDTEGFKQSGYASWYGKKFHGNKTSNGETYDMFTMTAAHKTLAIPTYVRVTNLENQRTVVVRVNDRGPFHDGRIIDLSYAAAKKLGYHRKGTAKVSIEVLPQVKDAPVKANRTLVSASRGAPAPSPARGAGEVLKTYLQVGAFSKPQSANRLHSELEALTIGYPVEVRSEPTDKLFKVLIGPIADNFGLLAVRQKLLEANMSEPHVVEF